MSCQSAVELPVKLIEDDNQPFNLYHDLRYQGLLHILEKFQVLETLEALRSVQIKRLNFETNLLRKAKT